MRNFTKLALGLALSSVMAFSASAEIIDSDWLNEGDGLTFTDTEQNLEFLDLSETVGMSIAEVNDLLDTTYAGWDFATANQVVSMLTNLFADTEVQYSTTDGSTQTTTAISSRAAIMNVVGGTPAYSSYYLYGLVNENDISMYGAYIGYSTNTYYNLNSFAETYSHAHYGTWLVRDSSAISLTDVPAPLALSSLALLGLGLTRRKHAKKDF